MKVLFVWLAVCLIWSTVWLFIKLGLNNLPPVSFAGMRLLIALIILAPFVFRRRKTFTLNRGDLTMIAGTGILLLGLNYALLYWGAQHISSGMTAVLQAVTPAFGLLFANYLLPSERVTPVKWFAVAVGVSGVFVIFYDQLEAAGWNGFLGSAAATASAACVAFGYVFVKARGSHLPPIVLTTGQMLIAVGPLLAFGLVFEGNPLDFAWTPMSVFSLFYLAIGGSVIAFGLNYWLLRRLDAATVMSMALVEPLVAVVLGAVILGETLSAHTAAGGSLVLASVGLILGNEIRERRSPQAAA